MFKNNIFIFMAALLAVLITQSAQAIIFRGEVWSKQRQDGTYQMVYCLNDIHHTNLKKSSTYGDYGYTKSEAYKIVDWLDTIAQQQKKELYDALSKFPKNNIMVLVEDIYSDSHGRSVWPEKLEQRHEIKFLGGITQDCINRNIPVMNLECRQSKGLMIRHLSLMNKSLNPAAFFEKFSLAQSFSDMQAESDAVIQEIKSYSISNDFLNAHNAQMIKRHTKEKIKIAKSLSQKGLDEALCRKAIAGDTPLLDLKAINYVYDSLDKQQDIVLIMGAGHIQNITKILRELGYKMVDEKGYNSSVVKSNTKEEIEHKFNEACVFDIAKFLDFEIINLDRIIEILEGMVK